jgi:exodeoxyribonuclease-3
MFRAVTANVNGVRAAVRRGGIAELGSVAADVICLQEVRASDSQLAAALAGSAFADWQVAHAPSSAAGRSGVAILGRGPLSRIRTGVGPEEFAESGRWLEASMDTVVGTVRLVSVYVHTGEADTPRQEEKYRFLDAMDTRLKQLARNAARTDSHVLVCGDLNIAHREQDIKNWRGNVGKAGFLDDERRYLSAWTRRQWVDLGRAHAGKRPGPYTWWSWRGQAFDNDAGWRIDYALATPGLASVLTDVQVGRASSYAARWSDHAGVTLDFEAAGGS